MLMVVRYNIQLVGYVFILQLLGIVILVKLRGCINLTMLLSPGFLTLMYLLLNFAFGSLAVYNNVGLENTHVLHRRIMSCNESELFLINSFFLLCNCIVFDIWLKRVGYYNHQYVQNIDCLKNKKILIACIVILIFLFFYQVNLLFVGSATIPEGETTGYNFYFRLVTIIVLSISVIYSLGLKKRCLFYALILAYMTVTSYSSKREIMFIGILFLFLESLKTNIRINFSFKKMLLLFVACICFFYIVVFSSIMRGYGNYQIESPIDAIKKVPEYIQEDYFLDAATANFEVSAAYGHSALCVHYVLNDDIPLQFGKTIIKFLFIPIPRYLFPDKPNGMIHIYTQKYDSSFRGIGGSYPVNVYSEMFANFYLFAPLFVWVLFTIFEKMYYKIIHLLNRRVKYLRLLILLQFYLLFIGFVRGDGLESIFLPVVVTFPLLLYFLSLHKWVDTKNNSMNIIKS